MKNLTDNEIIQSVLNGNHSDYSILINRYKNKAFSLLVRILKNKMEAEEVLQDCFLKAFKSLSGFKGESKFSTWFYSIVYNTALTKLSNKKTARFNRNISLQDEPELADENISGSVEQNSTRKLLDEIILNLPENNAAVINLFYLDGLSCEEIAKVMNISVSNVKILLYRSRILLKDLMVKKNLIKEFE